MSRFGFLPIAVIATIIVMAAHQAFALKCWTCNGAMPHCGESFKDVDKMNVIEKLTLMECSGEKCLKAVTNPIAGIGEVVLRLCVNTTQYAESFCKTPNQKFCEFCDSDGCNGAAQYGPTALLIAIPVAIAKLLLQ